MLLMDASETNFSGWRGAVDQAQMGFRRNQTVLIERFLRPVYAWKVSRWLEFDDEIRRLAGRDGVDVYGHGWNRPGWKYIQPLQDASADLLAVRNGLTSWRRMQATRGRDWQIVAGEIVADNALAIRLAKQTAQEINGEFPDDAPVHWRELISLPTPDGVSVALAEPVETGATV